MPRAGRSRAALLAASVVALGGACAGTGAEDAEPAFTGCVVSDTAGFADGSPGEAAWDGLQSAAAAGTGIELERVESSTEADFAPGLAAMVQAGCDLTVAAGPDLAAATRRAASAHPEARFAVVGDDPIDLPNVTSIEYGSGEAAVVERIAPSVRDLVREITGGRLEHGGTPEGVAEEPSGPAGSRSGS